LATDSDSHGRASGLHSGTTSLQCEKGDALVQFAARAGKRLQPFARVLHILEDPMEEKPLNMFEQSTKPGERITDKPELPPQGFAMHMVADTESIEGEAHLKLGKARGFEIFSDEPAHIGGTNKFPPPMSYLAMGIGF
jgi:hypothetical protein